MSRKKQKILQAEIDRLEKVQKETNRKYGDVLRVNLDYTKRIKELKEEVEAQKLKYAELLERHIKMMERMADNEQREAD